MQNLVKIGQSVAELLHVFDFPNGDIRHRGFSYFHNICQKFKFMPISTST